MATTKELEARLDNLEQSFGRLQEQLRDTVRRMSDQNANTLEAVKNLREEFAKFKEDFDKFKNVELAEIVRSRAVNTPDYDTHIGRY